MQGWLQLWLHLFNVCVRRMFCKHRHVRFSRNLYGDQIELYGGRSIWYCSVCESFLVKQDLGLEEFDLPAETSDYLDYADFVYTDKDTFET